MQSVYDVEFLLTGNVNGREFQMNGAGRGDSSRGTLELQLKADPEFPEGFDPVTCPMICSHPTSSFFARELNDGASFAQLTGGSYNVDPVRIGMLYNAKGEQKLNLQVRGRVSLSGRRVVSSNVMTGVSSVARIARTLTPISDYILPSVSGEATAMVRYQSVGVDGEIFDGQTIVPYRWENGRKLDAPLVRTVRRLDVHWNGGRNVSAYYEVDIATLTSDSAGTEYPMTSLVVSSLHNRAA